MLHTYNSLCNCIADSTFKEMIKVKCDHKGGALSGRTGALITKGRKGHQSWLSLSATWGHSENLTICKLGREILPEPNYTGTLISDFHPPELWENKFLLFKAT